MKKYDFFGIASMIVSIISAPFLFAVASVVGESEIFGIGGTVYYSWVIILPL